MQLYAAAHCRVPGCDSYNYDPRNRDQHEDLPHYRCSCGRAFVAYGLRLHLGTVKRKGFILARDQLPHPPVDDEIAAFAAGVRHREKVSGWASAG